MERSSGEHIEMHVVHDLAYVSPETVALRSLIDKLYQDSDTKAHKLLIQLMEAESNGEA